MEMNFKTAFFVPLFLLMLMSCNEQDKPLDLQTGDILFRGRQSSELSKAIDDVTQTGQAHHYTHMGIVEFSNDTLWVLHAAPQKGVCKELLEQFCGWDDETVKVGHYRLKNRNKAQIHRAINRGHAELGQPYNYTYIMEDEGYYCSEFIYELFAPDSVFQLDSMTFIDPQSGQFHPGWVKHYRKLGIAIPEGKLGCNPNGMAASDNLIFLGYLVN